MAQSANATAAQVPTSPHPPPPSPPPRPHPDPSSPPPLQQQPPADARPLDARAPHPPRARRSHHRRTDPTAPPRRVPVARRHRPRSEIRLEPPPPRNPAKTPQP